MKLITMDYWEDVGALPVLVANVGILWAAAKSGDYPSQQIAAHIEHQLAEASACGVKTDALESVLSRLKESDLSCMRLAGMLEMCSRKLLHDNRPSGDAADTTRLLREAERLLSNFPHGQFPDEEQCRKQIHALLQART